MPSLLGKLEVDLSSLLIDFGFGLDTITIRSYFRRRRISHRRFYIAPLMEGCTSIRKPQVLTNSGTLSIGPRAGVSGFLTAEEITPCNHNPGPEPEHRIGQDNML